jgi:CheY-like chemotaxis protein
VTAPVLWYVDRGSGLVALLLLTVTVVLGVVSSSRVLMIDDEVAVGRSMRLLLAPEHDVIPVTRAKDALERLLAGEHYDVILCDLMMPEMSVISFYEQLVRRAPHYTSRIVFLTGGAFTPESQEFLASVASPHLEKPFTERDLPCIPRGGVGFGVRLLARWVLACGAADGVTATPAAARARRAGARRKAATLPPPSRARLIVVGRVTSKTRRS